MKRSETKWFHVAGALPFFFLWILATILITCTIVGIVFLGMQIDYLEKGEGWWIIPIKLLKVITNEED